MSNPTKPWLPETVMIRYFRGNHHPWVIEGDDGYGLGESLSFDGVLSVATALDIKQVSIEVPCGCYACDEQVQQGHFACSTPPTEMLELEAVGKTIRYYNGTSWVWEAV